MDMYTYCYIQLAPYTLTCLAVCAAEARWTHTGTCVMLTCGTVLAQTRMLTVATVRSLGASVLACGTGVARGADAGAGRAVAGAPVVAQAHVLAVAAPPVHGARCDTGGSRH